jgi:hydrogenase maturation factor
VRSSDLDLGRPSQCFADADEGCITCGDQGVPVRVLSADATTALALCADASGATELIATELVGAVAPGDVLLVHAKVALAHLDRDEAPI